MKTGWYKENGAYALYDNNGNLVRTQTTDPKLSAGSGNKKYIVKSKTTSQDEEAERKKYIESHPNKTVTPEEYKRLTDLYEKAKAADATGKKQTKEAEEFQRAYHEILPEEASRIIAKHPTKTKKALAEGRTWWDLEGNVDGYFGPRTEQYMEELKKKQPNAKIAETPKLKEEEKKKDEPFNDIVVSHGDPEKERALPPVAPTWWLQDKLAAVNAGLNYLNIRPYYPWEPMANYEQVRPSFLSPERALAENQSQMNMQLGMLSQFTGPQAFNARANEISGKGFANAANAIADVHNRNVGIANQFEQTNVGIRNENQKENLAHATSLWDKYQATRQNFDNAKKMAADAMFNVAKQAITNRANTYNLNQMNPQYAVDPGTGGLMYFHDPRDLKPSETAVSISDRYKQMVRDNPTLAGTKEGREQLWEMTKIEHGAPSDYMSQYAKNRNIANQQVPYSTYPTQS